MQNRFSSLLRRYPGNRRLTTLHLPSASRHLGLSQDQKAFKSVTFCPFFTATASTVPGYRFLSSSPLRSMSSSSSAVIKALAQPATDESRTPGVLGELNRAKWNRTDPVFTRPIIQSQAAHGVITLTNSFNSNEAQSKADAIEKDIAYLKELIEILREVPEDGQSSKAWIALGSEADYPFYPCYFEANPPVEENQLSSAASPSGVSSPLPAALATLLTSTLGVAADVVTAAMAANKHVLSVQEVTLQHAEGASETGDEDDDRNGWKSAIDIEGEQGPLAKKLLDRSHLTDVCLVTFGSDGAFNPFPVWLVGRSRYSGNVMGIMSAAVHT
eukprot:Nk52_evm12s299 gene=Nk52_evmTU12s299